MGLYRCKSSKLDWVMPRLTLAQCGTLAGDYMLMVRLRTKHASTTAACTPHQELEEIIMILDKR